MLLFGREFHRRCEKTRILFIKRIMTLGSLLMQMGMKPKDKKVRWKLGINFQILIQIWMWRVGEWKKERRRIRQEGKSIRKNNPLILNIGTDWIDWRRNTLKWKLISNKKPWRTWALLFATLADLKFLKERYVSNVQRNFRMRSKMQSK